jgi:hypothetical protein
MNQTAQGLAALGRGPDTQLVHMAPGEVRSLQQLAMAHGGSLTINPETGLPEAGFLSSILPMVLGAGAMMIPGLQGFGAAGIAAGIGGLQALRTGSLKKGLMAGLGAYGGAGLAGGLTAAGAASGAGAAGAGTPEILGGLGAQPATFSGNLAQAGQGLTALPTSEAARTAFMGNAALKGSGVGGAKGLMQYGLAAASPMLMETTTKQPEIKTDKDMGQRYRFDAGALTPTPVADTPGYNNQGLNFGKERQYFNPMYRPIDNDAARKLYGFASGGPVEDMSNANSIGMNTGYPQADIRTGAYATPYQQPISRNVVSGAQGAAVNPYTGQAQFAEGGAVDSYTYDPTTQMYVKKSGEGATVVSPTGGISGASGSSGSGIPSGPPPTTTPEEFAAQSERNQKINDFLTNISAVLSPGATIARGLLDTPFAGGIANAFGGRQDPSLATVENMGTYAVGPAMQSMQDAYNADMSAAQSGVSGANSPGADAASAANAGENLAKGGIAALAQGGISNLGDYSDGGRLLRGPGDGISDSIPAVIGKKRPARLADGEFVVPARIVSELGNGSTEAGARKLYAMMDRVQKARKKTVGKGKVAANSRSAKYLPA